tara:strand:+ start:130 stop:291 length:162 start_codon:yes stop_codon:yes gene_type:complete
MINIESINELLAEANENFATLSNEIEELESNETTHEQEQYIAIVKQLLIYSQA